jgi:hypothetical protein
MKSGDEKESRGGQPYAVNGRMQLMAAISALEALKKLGVVDLSTMADIYAGVSVAGCSAQAARGSSLVMAGLDPAIRALAFSGKRRRECPGQARA